MIELRWLKKEIERDIDCCNPEPMHTRVLQYRAHEFYRNIETGVISGGWGEWTEWQNVPTVSE